MLDKSSDTAIIEAVISSTDNSRRLGKWINPTIEKLFYESGEEIKFIGLKDDNTKPLLVTRYSNYFFVNPNDFEEFVDKLVSFKESLEYLEFKLKAALET